MARAKVYATSAERVAAHRARKSLVTLTVDLPTDCIDGLNEYMQFKDMTKTQVIEKLIRTQLLRKR